MRKRKDSRLPWVGDIPVDWNVYRGKNVVKKLKRPVEETDGVITCFRDGEVTLRSNRREDGFTFSEQEVGYQGIEPGDLVIHGMDGFAGAIGISDSRGKGTPVLNVLDSRYDKRFLMYYFRAIAKCGYFESVATGIRVRTCDTNWNKISVTPCLVPPRDEQSRIATFLDDRCGKIDEAIAKHKALIEKLDEYKNALIVFVATHGTRNCVMKPVDFDWIHEMPQEWGIALLSQLFVTVKCKNTGLIETNLLSLSYGKIKQKDIDNNEGLVPANFEGYNIIENGDIVLRLTDLQNDQKSLRVGISTQRGIVTSAYVTIRSKQELCSKYFYYLLHSFDVCKGFYGMGGGIRQGLNWDELKFVKVLLPTLNEQFEIVAYLDEKCAAIDAAKERHSQIMTKLEEYKKSLIYNAVTGKIEC